MRMRFAFGVCVMAAAATSWWAGAAGAPRDRAAQAGFWFEPVSFEARPLGGALTVDDLATIERVARAELTAAFEGLAISITDRRDARYQVRVLQELVYHLNRHRASHVAGASSPTSRFSGRGVVSFTYFASGALVFAPPEATRAELIEAIGRGVGRGAVHEFAHQFLGASIHDTRDRGSYEYRAASRPEQYFGPMHWDVAGPLLVKRFGPN